MTNQMIERISTVILLFIVIMIGCNSNDKKNSTTDTIKEVVDTTSCRDCRDFDALYLKIRDGLISESDAKAKISSIIPKIKKYYFQHSDEMPDTAGLTFPVAGYNYTNIGGNNGDGYITSGYNFFDGNKHGGHPAFDVFIYDNNQDCIDDKTGKTVDIVAVTSGIIISSVASWDSTSSVRGGVCFILYDPWKDNIYYYAHNKTNLVKTGDIITRGQIIATMGRSGLNAFKKRSPTHLHIMCLKVRNDGGFDFVNLWNELKKAKQPL